MKEVACAVCGAMYRFAAAEIPPTGKTVICTRCKARVAVPGSATPEPSMPAVTLPSMPAVSAAPAPPADMPMAGGTGDVIDLADLPAPRRAGVASRSVSDVDLPAPKRASARPVPAAPGNPLDVPPPRRPREGEAMTLDSIDLLAPVGPVGRGAGASPTVPAGSHGGPPIVDLPAPKGPAGIVDLPAPKGPPAARTAAPPVARPPAAAPPIPRPPAAAAPPIVDLPMPKGAPFDRSAHAAPPPIVDLPAPKGAPIDRSAHAGPPSAISDLPVPKRAGTVPGAANAPSIPPARQPRTPQELFDDLPAPKGILGDLPAPKRPSAPDLPVPKRPGTAGAPDAPGRGSTIDLPAPKGFFDDLPQSASPNAPQLPAPKGFFDDLPQPALSGSPQLPAPKSLFDDLPQPVSASAASVPEVPAPKGFFDDLPQSALPQSPQVPAPKGFYDDLPQPAAGGGSDVPAPKGFYESGLQPASAAANASRGDRFGAATGAIPGNLSLDGLDLPPPTETSGLQLLDPLDVAPMSGERPATAPGDAPALELGDGDLGLELPVAAPPPAARSSVVSWKSGTGGGLGDARGGPPAEESIDLAVPSRRDLKQERAPAARPEARAAEPRLSPRLRRVALALVLLLAAAGAGGFFFYRRWEAKQQRAAEIERTLGEARRALARNDRGHWRKATRAANDVLQKERGHAEAAGIAAQGALAGYLDEGTDADQRLGAGRRILDQATAAGLAHPAIDKAGALRDLVEGNPADAIARLKPLADRGDADAQLYLGWAQLAAHRHPDAIAAFTAARKARPAASLYGLAQAQAQAGDVATAHATYLELIALDAEHVGALVGEALTAPSADLGRREAALLAILQRQGIDQADPRAVVLAWTRAGDDARRAGRLDAARERYKKALAILPADRGALVSTAALELADGNLDAAVEAVDKALALAPDDVAASLIAAELDLERDKVADAATRLAALRQRQPPVTAPDVLARLELIDGMRLEAERNGDAALAAYDRAAQVAPGDVAPIIAAATLLGRRAEEAEKAQQPDAAAAFRAQADDRLRTIAAAAETDANVAITLGVAYLSSGAPAQAERWLRGAIDKRPGAVEAHYQLAEALRRQGKQDEAVATLAKAFELDPTRIDLGVELARGYEAARRDADAAALYKRLLATNDVTADVRARAGRFFARHGDMTAASAQGELLLAIDPRDATGLFLRAEGLLAAGRPIDAKRTMQEAVNRDADPQFLDGLGRACEAHAAQTGDTAVRDEALRAYQQAAEKDATLLNPRLGAGRIHLARGEYERALRAYEAALRLAPRHPDIPHGIGLAYAELEDRERAIEWLARAVAQEPRADAYWKLGSMYFEVDRAGPAAAALERATQLATKEERDRGVTVPWLTDALWLLGTTQKVLGNNGAVKRAWTAYLARNPTNKAQVDEVRRALLPLQ